MMNIILGLDVSTTCIGLTLAANVQDKIDILQITHFKLKTSSKIKGMEALFHKSSYFEEALKSYNDLTRFGIGDLHVNKVLIEEPLVSSNNSGTVSTLLRFNGMISQSVYHVFGVIPEFISSYDARKYAFPDLIAIRKYNKKGEMYEASKIRSALKKSDIVLFGEYPWDCDKKYILWSKVADIYPNINWVYDKNNNLKKENFDASDSLICILGYVNKQNMADDISPLVVEFSEIKLRNGILFNYKTSFGEREYEKVVEIQQN